MPTPVVTSTFRYSRGTRELGPRNRKDKKPVTKTQQNKDTNRRTDKNTLKQTPHFGLKQGQLVRQCNQTPRLTPPLPRMRHVGVASQRHRLRESADENHALDSPFAAVTCGKQPNHAQRTMKTNPTMFCYGTQTEEGKIHGVMQMPEQFDDTTMHKI